MNRLKTDFLTPVHFPVSKKRRRKCPLCGDLHFHLCTYPVCIGTDDECCFECHAEKAHGILVGTPENPGGSVERRRLPRTQSGRIRSARRADDAASWNDEASSSKSYPLRNTGLFSLKAYLEPEYRKRILKKHRKRRCQ